MIGNSIEKLTQEERLILASSLLNQIWSNIVTDQIGFHKDIMMGLGHQAQDDLLARTYREHAAKLEIWVSIQQLQESLLKELNKINSRTGD